MLPPPEKDLEWSEQGVEGAWRFLNRVWRIVQQHAPRIRDMQAGNIKQDINYENLSAAAKAIHSFTHRTIKKAT
ncbi:MAG: hypothetical protein ABH870_04825 [bacterium]